MCVAGVVFQGSPYLFCLFFLYPSYAEWRGGGEALGATWLSGELESKLGASVVREQGVSGRAWERLSLISLHVVFVLRKFVPLSFFGVAL